MKKFILLFTALTAGIISAAAQNSYEYRSFKSSDGTDLKYRLLSPEKIKKGKKYPLVIFMHGAGERGDDNEKQLFHGSQMFLNPTNQEKYPAYVLFPQCPSDGYWAFSKRPDFPTMTPEEQITPILKAVKEMIDKYMDMPTVDASRVYIMGVSMGAMATYDLTARHPELFAAAIPICGAVAPGRMAAAKNIKFRIYHGDADNVVPVACSRLAYKELKEAGAKVEYFEFPGCNHLSWNPAFNQPDFMEWLFSQKKSKGVRK